MKKRTWLWVAAIAITALAGYWQRVSGPTYPLRTSMEMAGENIRFELPRSHGGDGDAVVTIPMGEAELSGTLSWKKYPSDEDWTTVEMVPEDGSLVGFIPQQPPAGKIAYSIELSTGGQTTTVPETDPLVIRFKGAVPDYVLIPHIAFMFLGMLASTLAGLMALAGDEQFRMWTMVAFGLLTVGGMILGPIVQLYAFDDLWTGVPFGWDLTDNKTLIGFIAFGIAALANMKKPNRGTVIAAAVIVLVIFSIPHSLFGSELNYETGEIGQG